MKRTDTEQNRATQKNSTRTENKNTLDGISQQRSAQIRQNSRYGKTNQASPDNNLFWEDESNPLSSKGN